MIRDLCIRGSYQPVGNAAIIQRRGLIFIGALLIFFAAVDLSEYFVSQDRNVLGRLIGWCGFLLFCGGGVLLVLSNDRFTWGWWL